MAQKTKSVQLPPEVHDTLMQRMIALFRERGVTVTSLPSYLIEASTFFEENRKKGQS